MKVSIYARVSTDDKEQDPERQLMKCRNYCDIHEHTVVGEWSEYHTGDSSPFERPESAKALNAGVEGIVIWSMDRLTREHPIKVLNLVKDLKDKGIKVISVSEPAFNMEHELSEVLLFLIGWFNNYFLSKLKKDIKSGLDRAVASGKVLGRPKASFNERRAYHLLFVQKNPKLSMRSIAADVGVSLGALARSKKVWEKNPPSFIKEGFVPNTDD